MVDPDRPFLDMSQWAELSSPLCGPLCKRAVHPEGSPRPVKGGEGPSCPPSEKRKVQRVGEKLALSGSYKVGWPSEKPKALRIGEQLALSECYTVG